MLLIAMNSALFSLFLVTQQHIKHVGVLLLYLCFSIFIVLCSGLALLDINQGRNDGTILNTQAHSQTGFAALCYEIERCV